MAAVVGGLTLVELVELLSSLAGTALTAAKLVQMIQQHMHEHPDAVDELARTKPELAAKLENQVFKDLKLNPLGDPNFGN